MIYRFISKAAGDLIVTGPVGDQMLRIIGKEPAVAGILSVASMPAAIKALAEAVAQDDGHRTQAVAAAAESDAPFQDAGGGVSLRQRTWPLQEMMRRAQDDGEPIVWSV
jgi:hypothetical protein